jgi:hypothetical protein
MARLPGHCAGPVSRRRQFFLFPVDQKAAKGRHVRPNGGAIDRLEMAGADEFFGLARQGDDVMPEDADADVVKVIVRKGCDVPLLFTQRMAFIAPAFRVEKLPAAFCRIIDGILLARNEVIERRIE